MSGLVSGATNSPPGLVGDPGVAKGWCFIAADGTIQGSTSYPNSYNIASITDGGTGDRTIVWDVDFSTVNYSISSTEINVGGHTINTQVPAVGSVQFFPRDSSNTNADAQTCHVAFGDQ